MHACHQLGNHLISLRWLDISFLINLSKTWQFFFFLQINKKISHLFCTPSLKKGTGFLAHLIEYSPSRIIFLLTNSKVNWYGTLNTSTESFNLCYIIWPNNKSKICHISNFSKIKRRKSYMAYMPEGKNLRGPLRISHNSANHNKYLYRNQEKISSGWLKRKNE